MQTFLPYENFVRSAEALDRQRLNSQRREALTMLKALAGKTKGWVNHPATLMWKGSEVYLAIYGICICQEWISRGYKDNLLPKIKEYLNYFGKFPQQYPKWLGNEKFHSSHRGTLLSKNYDHYSKFGWAEKLNMNIGGLQKTGIKKIL